MYSEFSKNKGILFVRVTENLSYKLEGEVATAKLEALKSQIYNL